MTSLLWVSGKVKRNCVFFWRPNFNFDYFCSLLQLGNLLWKAERLAQLFDWQRRTTFASAKHIECFLTIYSCNVCKCFRCFSTGGFRKSRGRGHSNDYSGSYNLFFFDVGLICFLDSTYSQESPFLVTARSEGCVKVFHQQYSQFDWIILAVGDGANSSKKRLWKSRGEGIRKKNITQKSAFLWKPVLL